MSKADVMKFLKIGAVALAAVAIAQRVEPVRKIVYGS